MKKAKDAVCVLCIIALYTAMSMAGMGCPIRFFTGISCAGCGMTRAWLCVFRLDFVNAFKYHPLFWIVPVVALMIIFRHKINDRLYKTAVVSMLILLIIVYAIRLINPEDTIVTCDITSGAIWKTINFVIRRFLR